MSSMEVKGSHPAVTLGTLKVVGLCLYVAEVLQENFQDGIGSSDETLLDSPVNRLCFLVL